MYSVHRIIAHLILVVLAVAVQFPVVSCSKKINTAESITDYLPDQTAAGLQRSDQVRQYNRETLWEYLDGGADIYLDHGFVKLAAADYRKHDLEFVADVFNFESPEKARQLYTIIRPPDVLQKLNLGQDGYLDPGMLVFVRGSCLVRLTGYIDTSESQDLLKDLASAIVRRMQVQQDGKAE